MPKTSPTTELVDWLATAGVLNLREAHALRRRCEELGSGVELEQVIAGLLAQKKLTKYQAAEIRAGRHEELVQGNYLLLDLIRAGPMGVVYWAQQMALRHEVALKILPEHVARAPDAEARFRREVEAIVRLKHPRIVAACDAGRMGRALYLAMEFIPGENLGEYVRRRGRLPVADALSCIVQASEGLAAAHAAGIVHRDVKPSNLMLTPEGEVKVLDLGLARFLSEEKNADSLTATEDLTGGGLLGTIDFIAPEQSRDSRTADHRADIYGLGCTLYYLLAAVPPAPPGDWRAKLAWHESAPIPRLANACSGASPRLQEAFDRMLARDPRQRFASCDELRLELAAIRADLPGGLGATVTLRAEAPSEPEPIAPPIIDPSHTSAIRSAQAETTHSSGVPVVVPSRIRRPSPVPQPGGKKSPWITAAIVAGAVAGVLTVVLLLAVLMNRRGNEPQPSVARKNSPGKAAKQTSTSPSAESTRSFARNTKFPIGTAVPQGLRWNEELKAEMERIFPSGVESDAGRNLYSDADTAMELFLDANWYVGSGLTTGGKPLNLKVTQGKYFTAVMSDDEADAMGLAPMSVRKSADSRLRMRSRPLMEITAAELNLVSEGSGLQRVQGRLQTKVLQETPIDSVSIVIEIASTAGREGTQQLYIPLEWKKTEAGWHTIDREDQGIPISGKFTYRLYLIAWSWSPRPGFFRVTQEYQDWFKEPATDP